MPQLNRLTNPYLAVFSSYRQRPMFWALAAVYIAYPMEIIGFTVSHVSYNFNSTFFVLRDVLLFLSGILSQLVLPILFAVAFMTHLRQQLAGPERMLVPGYRPPHLRVAAFTFILAALAISFAPIGTAFFMSWRPFDPFQSFDYRFWISDYAVAFLVTLTLMTITAWLASFITSWTAVVFAPIVFIAMLAANFNPYSAYERMFNDIWRDMPRTLVSLGYVIFAIVLPIIGAALTLLFNFLALSALWRRLKRIAEKRLVEEPPTRSTSVDSRFTTLRRNTLPTRWSRIRHLLSAGITLAAPWITALLLTAILMFIAPLLLNGNRPYMQMQISLILATILPSVAVICLWSERWPRLGLESLFPFTRNQFVSEIFSAIAIDLLHFWIAASIAAVLPLLLIPAAPLHPGVLITWLFASCLMQLLAFAAILWSMWFRSWPTLAILLSLPIAAMAAPLTISIKNLPLISVSTILPLSTLIALIGLVFTALSYHHWLRGNWL